MAPALGRLEDRRRPLVTLALAALCAAALVAAPRAFALDDVTDASDDIPGARLGFGSYDTSSGSLLGFLNRDRFSHSRSLAFGMSMSNAGSASNLAGATYSDYFAYRLRDNLTMNLALHYNFVSTFRSADEERGQFSVLPSFAMEYHPSPNTLIQFSYGQYGGGYPYASGRPRFPY
jgi:hypothetical protein